MSHQVGHEMTLALTKCQERKNLTEKTCQMHIWNLSLILFTTTFLKIKKYIHLLTAHPPYAQ